tara:strand:- start:153 stop:263 length:111 start_codon:yes stop_codon:yes gene_type:complete
MAANRLNSILLMKDKKFGEDDQSPDKEENKDDKTGQ